MGIPLSTTKSPERLRPTPFANPKPKIRNQPTYCLPCHPERRGLHKQPPGAEATAPPGRRGRWVEVPATRSVGYRLPCAFAQYSLMFQGCDV